MVWKQTSGGLILKFSSNFIYSVNVPPETNQKKAIVKHLKLGFQSRQRLLLKEQSDQVNIICHSTRGVPKVLICLVALSET